MLHSDIAGIAGYIVASMSIGLISYSVGILIASKEADKQIASMRKEYIEAINAMYQKLNMATRPSLPPPPRSSAKPRPKFHVFRNEDRKDDQPSK